MAILNKIRESNGSNIFQKAALTATVLSAVGAQKLNDGDVRQEPLPVQTEQGISQPETKTDKAPVRTISFHQALLSVADKQTAPAEQEAVKDTVAVSSGTSAVVQEDVQEKDTLSFKQEIDKIKAGFQRDRVDMAEDFLDEYQAYRDTYYPEKPNRKDFDSRADYKKACHDQKIKLQGMEEERREDQMALTGMAMAIQIHNELSEKVVPVYENIGVTMDVAVKYKDQLQNNSTSSKEYKTALKQYKKEVRKNIKKVSVSNTPVSNFARELQEMGKQMNNEKKRNASSETLIEKVVKSSEKVIREDNKQQQKQALALHLGQQRASR